MSSKGDCARRVEMMSVEEPGLVIVGASLAGLTCAQSLRAEGYTKKITLIGAEKHLPYNRPPLSKQVLSGKWQGSQTAIDSSEKFAELALEFSLGESAIGLDVSSKEVKTNTRTLAFEDLIIATGASVRRLASTENMSRVHVLRTLDDALGLRDALTEVKSVVVVGAGVLGSEVISALSDFGIKATVIDRMPAPQLPLTGGHFASRINDLFLEHNVLTKYGVEINSVTEQESGITFELSDGSSVTGDIAVVAIGCIPNVDWLANSGLDISNGVLCDSNGQAVPHIYAVGDVARWHNPVTDKAMRLENQTSAIEQGLAVGKFIVTRESSPTTHPFFWSEIYGNKILMLGSLEAGIPLTIVHGSPSDNRFVAATISNGITTGIVGWNMPREFRQSRSMMEA
jgi:NADPH-dependent 2,4-dienoyl-CoA reductase/sulfur reductase-like enzyme